MKNSGLNLSCRYKVREIKFCAIVILQRNIRSEPSIFTYVVSPLFSPFSYTHISATERSSRLKTTHHQPQLFLSRWRYIVCGAGGPLVVVILKVDSSHETFGSKLKQLSSRTVKKNCCGERGLPALSKKFFITVPKNFPTKVFSQKQKVLASLDKVLQLRYYYSFGSWGSWWKTIECKRRR